MNLPGISIRRPVFATVMSLVLTLLGVISYTRLSVREYPKIDPPVVSVRPFTPVLPPKLSKARSPGRSKAPWPGSRGSR